MKHSLPKEMLHNTTPVKDVESAGDSDGDRDLNEGAPLVGTSLFKNPRPLITLSKAQKSASSVVLKAQHNQPCPCLHLIVCIEKPACSFPGFRVFVIHLKPILMTLPCFSISAYLRGLNAEALPTEEPCLAVNDGTGQPCDAGNFLAKWNHTGRPYCYPTSSYKPSLKERWPAEVKPVPRLGLPECLE